MIGRRQGYGQQAEILARQYETLPFVEIHGDTLHLFPKRPSRVLDVGAGSGRDAAALAALGHQVVAVEPVPELRRIAQQLHPTSAISWMDDHLPNLGRVLALGQQFELILLTAVWMHLSRPERAEAMQCLSRLLAPSGSIIMSIRHGPAPKGRRMFEVPAQETVDLAARNGLTAIYASEREDLLGRRDVSWTVLGLARARGCVKALAEPTEASGFRD